MKVGDPLKPQTDIGPLINESAAIKIEETVDNALNDRAELLYSGKRKGTIYMPTVLDNVESKIGYSSRRNIWPDSPLN